MRELKDHPYFSEHECERCAGVGRDFFCEKCDVLSPDDCLHVMPWLDNDPNWDEDDD